MRIKRVISQHRRDFQAVYECEHCNHKETKYGYDDDHFHNDVIPQMPCKACKRVGRLSDYDPREPRYSALEVV